MASCVDEDYHKEVKAPLLQAQKNLKWLTQKVGRGGLGGLNVKMYRKVIQEEIKRLTGVDEHLSKQ